MSRPPRKLSQTGLYHIIFRGINRQNIFEEDDDYKKMLTVIKKVKKEKGFELYAYCFMSNHVHLFLKEKNKEVTEGRAVLLPIITSNETAVSYKVFCSAFLQKKADGVRCKAPITKKQIYSKEQKERTDFYAKGSNCYGQ